MGRKGFTVDGIAFDDLTVDGDYVDLPDSDDFKVEPERDWAFEDLYGEIEGR